jgi:phosphoribosylaminoimidazolecarboxamide formyltransferase/IMP cyclohydrolase
MVIVKQALLSCSDKTGLEAFAKGLTALGVRLIASSGTATYLKKHGVAATPVDAFTGAGEQLDGRVKTLHPKIHAGILARRDDSGHVKAAGEDGLIDLVVVNLYPFEQTTLKPDAGFEEIIEQIDIGGVALLRAAAKNFRFVGAVSGPGQYGDVLAALRQGGAQLSDDASRTLAAEAFRLTSAYDQAITLFLQKPTETTASLPDEFTVRAIKRQPLRYGENPHQQAAWYVSEDAPEDGLAAAVQHHGKELSYNNLLDLDAAVRCVMEFREPACVIVKHAAPCGAASAHELREAYEHALRGDEESAFGGIVAINRPLDAATATAMSRLFLEVIAAPEISSDAVAVFAHKPNVRLIQIGRPHLRDGAVVWRSILGGWLVQQDDPLGNAHQPRVVTTRAPTHEEQRDLAFAWLVVKHVRSNAIVLARHQATVAIGQGQPSRVRAVRLAVSAAGERASGSVLASDGFFPFPDNVEVAARAGITAIIQPGGSIKDPDVIAAADRAGLAMVLTDTRHFRH